MQFGKGELKRVTEEKVKAVKERDHRNTRYQALTKEVPTEYLLIILMSIQVSGSKKVPEEVR